MATNQVLAVDLGQSGTRFKQGDLLITSDRGKVAGENPTQALRAAFESTQRFEADVVALSCTGFYGVVSEPQQYLDLCREFFGATQVAVIDDGFDRDRIAGCCSGLSCGRSASFVLHDATVIVIFLLPPTDVGDCRRTVDACRVDVSTRTSPPLCGLWLLRIFRAARARAHHWPRSERIATLGWRGFRRTSAV